MSILKTYFDVIPKLAGFLLYQTLFILWVFHIHNHFFGFTIADGVSLGASALLPLLFFRKTTCPSLAIVALILLLIIPFLIFPVINQGLGHFDYIVYVLYVFLVITGAACLLVRSILQLAVGLIPTIVVWFLPYTFNPDQHLYYDKVVSSLETRKGEVHIARWKSDHWIYYNKQLQVSTIDGHMFGEIFVHTVAPFFHQPNVLVIGGDNGFVIRELLKYDLASLTQIPYDPDYHLFVRNTLFAGEHFEQVSLPAEDPFEHLSASPKAYNLIIVDMPDPEDVDYRQFYGLDFFTLCQSALADQGILISGAGSNYVKNGPLDRIDEAVRSTGLYTTRLHAQVPTLGQRNWIIGQSDSTWSVSKASITVPTTWINEEAIDMMTAFGKKDYPH